MPPRSRLLRIGAWSALAAPFLLLAIRYDSLPDPLPLFRKLTGGVSVWGEKSPLTAFRVPAIAALMGAAIEILAGHAERAPDLKVRALCRRLWGVLLGTLAVKTIFQAIDFAYPAAPEASGAWRLLSVAAPLAVVLLGLGVALQSARQIYAINGFRLGAFTRSEKAALLAILAAYLLAAFLPLAISAVPAPAAP